MPATPQVRRAIRAELPQVGRVLAAAFDDDPVWDWMAGPSPHRADRAARWFTTEAAIAFAGHGEVWVDDEVRGAAIWFPPARWRSGPAETARLAVPSIRFFRSRLPRALRTLTVLERAHPRDEHWYLAYLGTDPATQGKGVGSALLAEKLRQADDEGLPAYLESSKESNISFYRRHGFKPSADPLGASGGPVLHPMWREASGPL